MVDMKVKKGKITFEKCEAGNVFTNLLLESDHIIFRNYLNRNRIWIRIWIRIRIGVRIWRRTWRRRRRHGMDGTKLFLCFQGKGWTTHWNRFESLLLSFFPLNYKPKHYATTKQLFLKRLTLFRPTAGINLYCSDLYQRICQKTNKRSL